MSSPNWQGTIPFGYRSVGHRACLAGNWDEVRRQLLGMGRTEKGVSQGLRELKDFYGLPENTLWVTMADGHFWWAFAEGPVVGVEAGNSDEPARYRRTRAGWSKTSLTGEPLTVRSLSSALTRTQHAGRERIGSRRKDARQLGPQETQPLPHRYSALQHEGADLIDDASALTDKPLPHPVQRLQVELLRGLGRHELHRRALHGFGNRFGIIEVVLLSLRIGADIFGRHQPGIVTQRCEFAAQVMCADAGFHAD